MKKIYYWFKQKFKYTKLNKEDFKGYKSLLIFVYHNKSEVPVLSLNRQYIRYFVYNPQFKIDLIIDDTQCEIINSNKIWKLELNPIIYQKIIKHLNNIHKNHILSLEKHLKDKKINVYDELFNNIK